jgi:chromosomal replication initiator protein
VRAYPVFVVGVMKGLTELYADQMPAALPPKEAWEVARSQLRLQMTKGTYDTWVRDTVCLAHEDGAFVIGVPNAYARDWLTMRLRGLIIRTLGSIVGHTVEVSFVVRPTAAADGPEAAAGPLLELEATVETDMREPATGSEYPMPSARTPAPMPVSPDGTFTGASDNGASGALSRQPAAQAAAPASAFPETYETVEPRAPATPPITEGANLNPRYTFDNFIVGSSNRMAHAVAMSVAERPGRAYNPLFLYGGVGLGKTHLLQAIGHAAQINGLAVLYVSSESFTNDMISAIRTQSTEQFRAKYRTIDVLLIDDVHFIAGKEQTQEEFFHTFNTLYAANRQIVMTSDRPPQAIATLEERLRSRFGWGMTADIQPPNLETRIAILQAKAASLGLDVPDDVLALVAQRAHRNIRDLEGALTRVLAHAQLMGRPLNPSLVEDALAYLAPAQSKLTLEEILDIAAAYFGIRTDDLTGRNRSARIALQRQIVMYVMREETGASLPQIGAVLGDRDHTTVIHGVERVNGQIESDAGLRREVTELRERLYQPTRRSG